MATSAVLSRASSSATLRSAEKDTRSPAAAAMALRLPRASSTNAASHASAAALPGEMSGFWDVFSHESRWVSLTMHNLRIGHDAKYTKP